MERVGPGQMQIGEALASARVRAGLEIADVEQRTKIRARYLRALENEAWEELPTPAYAKGYLRSYADLLGLDADTLVDEYRRQAEHQPAASSLRPEGVLARGPQGAGAAREQRSRGWLLAAGLIGAIAVLIAIGLMSGDEEPDRTPRGGTKAGARQEKQKHEDKQRARQGAGPVHLRLAISAPVEICLLGEGREELIDGQVLTAGSHDEYIANHFQLRFPTGFKPDQLRIALDGERRRLPGVRGPAAFRITRPARIRQAPPPERSCP